MKIISIVGARPNFMKIAPLLQEFKKYSNINSIFIHTGQHYDKKMSDLFFNELQIPEPDIFFGVGSDTHAKQVAKIMMKFDDICISEKPDAILVVGDVNSTMACTLVASKLEIKIIHLEAGLRSYDRSMPEEINRIITDSLADYLLTPSLDANENLLKEGIPKNKIFFVGNIMIDTLLKYLPITDKSQILQKHNLFPKEYVLITLHRPSNVDNKNNFIKILEALNILQKQIKIIFPVHPRTYKNITNFQLDNVVKKMPNLLLTEPLGYLDFQKLMSNSKLVITDSGGIQEETTVLKIPNITVRENTERPITITKGTNELIGLDTEKLVEFSNKAINGNWKKGKIPKFWDGKTSQRIINIINSNL